MQFKRIWKNYKHMTGEIKFRIEDEWNEVVIREKIVE